MGRRARRGRGEGAIYERSDGLWVTSVSLGYDGQGKRRRRTVYGRTKEEVRAKLALLQNDALNGTLPEPQRITVAAYLQRWLEDSARPSIRLTTYTGYEGIIRRHIVPQIGRVQLTKLTPAHVQGVYAAMERAGLSPRMRALAHAVLHKALDQAVKWSLVSRNVCDALQRPRALRREMRYLTPAAAAAFIEAAREDRLYALYLLAVTTGLRQGELLGLHWEDVDLKVGVLSVRRTLIEVKGKLSLGEPKSSKARRRVDLPAVAVEALREHRKRMLAEGHPGPWVFCNVDGGPIRKSNLIRYSFKPLLHRAGLPEIRFHDLRHTAATLLFAEGVHPKVVQERLGHSQISVTLDTYSHVLPSLQREAAERLDRLFRSTGH